MSVIAGILDSTNEASVERSALPLMRALAEYPADDNHCWQQEHVFLACRHLRVTGESAAERLPRYDEKSGLAITADAVIDNRSELIDRLAVELPHRKHITDSELILLAYAKWGTDAPRFLSGDFAFMIWDPRRQLLFGARDLVGSRSLHYARHSGGFAFCSAIRPLLAWRPKRLNEAWLADYLAIPGLLESADASSTAYEGIFSLPPGHAISVTGGNVRTEQYDSFRDIRELRLKTDGDYVDAFRNLFQEAVASRIRTPHPVGATLSGGLDSGSVASFAARALQSEGRTLHTFSYIPPSDFQEWTSGRLANETPYIDATIRHAGNMSPHYLDFHGESPVSAIDECLSIMEAPYKFVENSFWINGLYRSARQSGIRVLLTGTRGNHAASWGPALEYYSYLLRSLKWRRLYRELLQYGRRSGIARRRLLRIIGGNAASGLKPFGSAGGTQNVWSPLIDPGFAARSGATERLRSRELNQPPLSIKKARGSYFNDPLALHVQGAAEAKFSHHYGVMERDPTADSRLVKFCLSLPLEQFVQNGQSRSLIRRSTEGYLPNEVRLNQRVRGIQGADWLHRVLPSWSAFSEEVKVMCRDSRSASYLNIPYIRQTLGQIGEAPRPESAFDPEIRNLLRSMVVYRFLKSF